MKRDQLPPTHAYLHPGFRQPLLFAVLFEQRANRLHQQNRLFGQKPRQLDPRSNHDQRDHGDDGNCSECRAPAQKLQKPGVKWIDQDGKDHRPGDRGQKRRQDQERAIENQTKEREKKRRHEPGLVHRWISIFNSSKLYAEGSRPSSVSAYWTGLEGAASLLQGYIKTTTPGAIKWSLRCPCS